MPLRAVEVKMAAGLTNAEIRAYYKVGRVFNVGSGPNDRMTRVKSVRILK